MKTYTVVPLLLMLLIAGCATIKDIQKEGQFEDISVVYEDAVRWSDFNMAQAFIKQDEADGQAPDTDKLKQIKVTAYNVKRTFSSSDKNTVNQIVEISYYWLSNPVVKSLTDHQTWEYSSTAKTWHLTSGLPDFK
jgi:hypothetical protein